MLTSQLDSITFSLEESTTAPIHKLEFVVNIDALLFEKLATSFVTKLELGNK